MVVVYLICISSQFGFEILQYASLVSRSDWLKFVMLIVCICRDIHSSQQQQQPFNILPLSPFSICNGPRHPLYSAYMLDSPLEQPLSRSSLVFFLVLNPQLHTPCISSPNHHNLFAAHAHTNAACSAAISMPSSTPSLSLSSLLGSLSFSLTPHMHLTILISARWSATTFSFLTGQVSLPCNMLHVDFRQIAGYISKTVKDRQIVSIAWQLARFQLTRRIARSLGDSWASCYILR